MKKFLNLRVGRKFNKHSIMSIHSKLESIRTTIRKNSKSVIDNIIENHIQRKRKVTINKESDICVFCSSPDNLTKEHVIPRWLFEKCTQGFFVTDINGLSQTYNKTTIPVCSSCNSDRLNTLEKYISQLFEDTDLKKTSFSDEEIENIIRWLEIIDYKFQILNVIRKFKVSKKNGYIPYLADFPLSMLRLDAEYTPAKVIAEIRRSQKRITVKRKAQSINSLVTFKTSNKSFNFFHHMDDFIFIELPKQQIALFYFYKKVFVDEKDAHKEAITIINKFY